MDQVTAVAVEGAEQDPGRPDGTDARLAAPPRRAPPAAVDRRPAQRLLAGVATVCIGAFMNQLDASIVTVAFPTLQRSFHAGSGRSPGWGCPTCWSSSDS